MRIVLSIRYIRKYNWNMIAVTCLVFLCLLLMMGCREGAGEDVFASSAHLQMLDAGERDLIDAVKSYIIQEKTRIERVERFIKQVERSRAKDGSSDELTNHPVDVFHLIYRFTTTWKENIFTAIFDSSAAEKFKVRLQFMEALIPTGHDYDGARSAIIRLQHTYQLPVSDLINGTVLGYKTQPMTQQMALDVCLFALYRSLADDALEWVTHAQNHLVPPTIPLPDIYHITAKIYAQKGQFLKAVDFVKKSLELEPSNARFLTKLIPDVTAIGAKWPYNSDFQDKLCKEYMLDERMPNRRTNVWLSCVYKRGRVVPFLRVKVEHLHRSPDVVMFHDFITDIESKHLQQLAKSKIRRAMVGHRENPEVTEERVGKTAWFFDNSEEPIIDKISRRVSDVTGLETKHPAAEALQLSNYGLGGHYNAHYDHNVDRLNKSEDSVMIQEAGDRMATLMIYLNSVEAGGATVFPDLNLGTRPVKNAAVFWYNYKHSGVSEPKSLHAGCPVLIGEKWVANKWIREFGQEFRRPCELTIDA